MTAPPSQPDKKTTDGSPCHYQKLRDGDRFTPDGETWYTATLPKSGAAAVYASGSRGSNAPTIRVDVPVDGIVMVAPSEAPVTISRPTRPDPGRRPPGAPRRPGTGRRLGAGPAIPPGTPPRRKGDVRRTVVRPWGSDRVHLITPCCGYAIRIALADLNSAEHESGELHLWCGRSHATHRRHGGCDWLYAKVGLIRDDDGRLTHAERTA